MAAMDSDTKHVICRALRSGKFKQSQEYRTNSLYTCVGGVIVQTYCRMHGLKDIQDRSIRFFNAWMGMDDSEMNEFADHTEAWNKWYTFRQVAELIDKHY
jgi:hypothetical protein